VIHRDVKPANIFLETVPGRAAGRVKLLDFGLARATHTGDAGLTQAGLVVGTPGYMAPEQARGQPLDPRCDLFSLGCVIHRMAAGEDPFRGDNPLNVVVAVTLDEVPPLTALRPDAPPELAALTARLLAKAADDRPPTAAAVAAELAALGRAATAPARPAPAAPVVARRWAPAADPDPTPLPPRPPPTPSRPTGRPGAGGATSTCGTSGTSSGARSAGTARTPSWKPPSRSPRRSRSESRSGRCSSSSGLSG
jgi:serine/threonine protein kinase